jgi:hypothetical protein
LIGRLEIEVIAAHTSGNLLSILSRETGLMTQTLIIK